MTVDYKPIANSGGANVETQAQYITDLGLGGVLVNGFQSGVAPSAKFNKVVRQSSMVAAAVATFISQQNSTDVLDDGNLTALVTALTTAITNAALAATNFFTTGDVKLTLKTVADTGWVMCNDGSIGDSSSSATTRANADTVNLFTLLWNNVADAQAPVSGGRGASAAADFAAHKRLTLTQMLGRAIALSGAGAGLTARSLGLTLGEETHTMTISELVSHVHTYQQDFAGPPQITISPPQSGGLATQNTGATGGGTPFNVMQPTTFLNAMIRL